MTSFTSGSFARYLNRMPFEQRGEGLKKILPHCTQRFQELAGETLSLISTIRKEFEDQRFDAELGSMVANLARLAEGNRELFHRSEAFGTDEQKGSMKRLLDKQITSLEAMHGNLKSFSGNLALIEASADQGAAPAEDLKFINQGFQEIIKELENEKR